MKRHLTLFCLLAFVLTSIWFGPKKIIAHAEEGLPFYNPIRAFEISTHLWQETGFGHINPFLTSRISFDSILASLYLLGIPKVTLQQLIFFLLILVPLITMPRLVKRLFPDIRNYVGFYAALLYVFNLFFVSQVLHRFIYEFFLLWSYLPLFTYLWLRWLDSRKIKYFTYFILAALAYSSIHAIVALTLALWIPAGVLWLGNRKLIPAILMVGIWFLISAWWWYPLISIKDSAFNGYLDSSKNLVSLTDVSIYYPNSEIFLLKQKYYFNDKTIWFNYYNSRSSIYISWLEIIALITGILLSIKESKGKLILLWLIVAWFLIKGTNPPFGVEFYGWIFKTFPFSQVLRNTYEKLGVTLVLPYSILVAIGISKIPFRIIRITIIFLICFVLLRPLWTGQVFTGYQIEVPKAYDLANNYLNRLGNLRLLHLPFLHGSGLSYSWGYSGDEPSEFLFDRPSVSKTYNFPGDPYEIIYNYLRNKNVYRLFQFLAIDTIVLHKDMLPGVALQENYEGTKSIVEKMDNIHLDKKYEVLDVYKLNSNIKVNWGYVSNNFIRVKTINDGFNMVVNDNNFNINADSFITSDLPFNNNFGQLPKFKITKLSPVHYKFSIEQAKNPFVIILLVSYSDSWKAFVNKQQVKNHFIVNGFANGWVLDKEGSYVVDIVLKTLPWE